MENRIAILATGDELTQGDILNTNAQHIAQQLCDNQIHVGQHVICSDSEEDIKSALRYLLNDHNVVITIGGLGPTSDDRTRFAIAAEINTPLEFHEPSWQAIVARISRMHLNIPESNRNQALFPKNAIILENPRGTAAGCQINCSDKKTIFMLPGPPKECLPMFNTYILPYCVKSMKAQSVERFRWRLFDVSEGEMASSLDQIAKDYDCITGYRAAYPYLEFKLTVFDRKIQDELINKLQPLLEPHIICPADKSATESLIEFLENFSGVISIDDQATGGLLQSLVQQPEILQKLYFISHRDSMEKQTHHFTVRGLSAYWQKETSPTTEFNVSYQYQDESKTLIREIPYRHNGIVVYSVELIAYMIQDLLKQSSS